MRRCSRRSGTVPEPAAKRPGVPACFISLTVFMALFFSRSVRFIAHPESWVGARIMCSTLGTAKVKHLDAEGAEKNRGRKENPNYRVSLRPLRLCVEILQLSQIPRS